MCRPVTPVVAQTASVRRPRAATSVINGNDGLMDLDNDKVLSAQRGSGGFPLFH